MTAYKVYRLIATHAFAVARLEDAAVLIDLDEAEKEKRDITEADDAEWNLACALEERALDALLRYAPEATTALRRKIAYIELHTRHSEPLTREQIGVLFSSLMNAELHSAA